MTPKGRAETGGASAGAEGSTVGEREVVISRVFDAPRELVFDAYTDPAHIGQWWGPDGFRTTTHAIDVRPGGSWRYTMHGPDGTDFPNRIDYREVERPERLVYSHGGDVEGRDVDFEVVVTFEDVGGRTRLTMRSLFPTAEARDFVVQNYGAVEGGKQHLDRLAQYLANA